MAGGAAWQAGGLAGDMPVSADDTHPLPPLQHRRSARRVSPSGAPANGVVHRRLQCAPPEARKTARALQGAEWRALSGDLLAQLVPPLGGYYTRERCCSDQAAQLQHIPQRLMQRRGLQNAEGARRQVQHLVRAGVDHRVPGRGRQLWYQAGRSRQGVRRPDEQAAGPPGCQLAGAPWQSAVNDAGGPFKTEDGRLQGVHTEQHSRGSGSCNVTPSAVACGTGAQPVAGSLCSRPKPEGWVSPYRMQSRRMWFTRHEKWVRAAHAAKISHVR